MYARDEWYKEGLHTVFTIGSNTVRLTSIEPVNQAIVEKLQVQISNIDPDLVVLIASEGRDVSYPLGHSSDPRSRDPGGGSIGPVLELDPVVGGRGEVSVPCHGEGVGARRLDLNVERQVCRIWISMIGTKIWINITFHM